MRGRLFKIVLFCCAILLCSCSMNDKVKNIENNAETVDPQNTIDPLVSAIEYDDSYYQNRVSIMKCKMNFESDVETIKNLKSDILSFDSCEFDSIDKLQSVTELQIKGQDVTPEESVDVIKKWLKKSKLNDVDSDKDIRDSSGQYEGDEKKRYPYDLPAVAEHYPDFDTGNFFFISTKQCHIQMAGRGVASMSDGTINKYLGSKHRATWDVWYDEEAEIVAEGKVSELADKSWKLLSGKMTVQDAADLTKAYFEQGTFFPCTENISVDVPEVKVFRLKKRYGYIFRMRRVYQGIPFAYLAHYGGTFSNKNNVSGDDKVAFVVNDQTVSACRGDSESDDVTEVSEPQDYIVDIQSAVSILEKNLIPEGIIDIGDTVDIKEAGFVYCPCTAYMEEEKNAYPCWEFRGILGSTGENINLYVNALNGQIYSYGVEME